jgi:hypothetical protein
MFDYEKVRSLRDIGLTVSYKYNVLKKYNVFAVGGVEYSKSTHYLQILEDGGSHLDNVIIDGNRIGLKIGISKQFHFYNSRLLLEFGFNAVKRISIFPSRSYSSDFVFNETQDWIEYKYDLTAYYDDYFPNDLDLLPSKFKNINLESSIGLKYKLVENLYLNTNLTYTRNNIFFYDFSYTINYYMNGSSTPTSTYKNLGIQDGYKFAIRDHYLYFSAGLSYKFNWNKED